MRFLIGLLVLILLGSCASENPLFIKRRYTRGYYVNVGSDKSSTLHKDPVSRFKYSLDHKGEVIIASSALMARTLFNERALRAPFNLPNRKSVIAENAHRIFSPANDLQLPKALSSNSKRVFSGIKTYRGVAPISEGPGVALVCFLVFTLLYTLCMMAKAPEMNFWVALGLGMLGALFTVLTGEVINC